MEFTQNLPPICGGYVHKNNFFHVGGSKILVEMCWMYTTLDFLVRLNVRRFIVGASPELKFRTTDKAIPLMW